MDGKVYTLSLADGENIWEFDTGSPVEALPLLVKKKCTSVLWMVFFMHLTPGTAN